MRRAKIVATMGPATADYATVERLVRAGMDVARINLRHGDTAAHDRSVAQVRRASETTGRAVAILADLPGDSASHLAWALSAGVDLIAPPVLRDPDDARWVRDAMADAGRRVPLVAKLGTPEAIDRVADIIDAFDGVIVARGDLSAGMALEAVPIVQKEIIELARRWATPVIVSTQLLESMTQESVPTRAETSDIANAVLDGADALMLSGETGIGRHPVAVVETMARVIVSTEDRGLGRIPALGTRPRTQGGAMTLAAATIAEFVDARCVCVFSQSGDSARRMSRLRHPIPIVAFTDLPSTRSRTALLWGVETHLVPRAETTDELVAIVDDVLLATGRAVRGDTVVVTAGAPPGQAGTTNNVRVHTVGASDGS